MAVKPSRAGSDASGAIEIDKLSQLRLSRNWSYQELADDMARRGHPLHSKTLQTLMTRRSRPYDRTLYQMRQYLAKVDAESRDERPARQRASA